MLSTGRPAALLLALVCALYYNALDNQFHYDDFHSIVRNPHGGLAMLSKSVAVVLVVVLVLCDWLVGRDLRKWWPRYLPFAVLALCYALFSRALIDKALLAPVRPLDGSGIVLVVIGLVAMAQWMADTHFCLELGRRTTRPDLCCAADCPGQRTPSLSVCGGLVFTRGLAL